MVVVDTGIHISEDSTDHIWFYSEHKDVTLLHNSSVTLCGASSHLLSGICIRCRITAINNQLPWE